MSNTFMLDESGQWWFEFGGGRRVRAKVAKCPTCDKDFPTYRNNTFCSHACKARSTAVTPDLRLCMWCEKSFTPGEKEQRFCSHSCAAESMHSRRQVTTRGVGAIKGAENPRFQLDEQGQWWYVAQYKSDGRTSRTRAHVKKCEECNQQFLTSIFHQKKQRFCSKSCKSKVEHRENPDRIRGENHPAWRGGKMVTPKGYIQVLAPYHPSLRGTQRRYVLEHRLVMEQMKERFLLPNEYVHHKNGIRHDNRPENLELWVGQQPPGQRENEQRVQHCPTCTCHLKAKDS